MGAFGDAGTFELVATTRTTLENCFVDLATGFVGLISGFDVVSMTGFVSITGDIGVSLFDTAFGNAALKKIDLKKIF